MKETIYTIPINESFEQLCGCPLCRLHDKLESDSLEYIMGAAMMESDVREQCNTKGFCSKHYTDMLAMQNRLSLALTVESRLCELKDILSQNLKKPMSRDVDMKKVPTLLTDTSGSCFVCERVDSFMLQYYINTVYMWKNDDVFRNEKFARTPYFCLFHASKLLEHGAKELRKKDYTPFSEEVVAIINRYLCSLLEDVSTFCKSFDYRNAGKDIGNAKVSVEKAVVFLSGTCVNLEDYK
ncbi:MAG: hypothetical protein GX633_07885 [Clostridiales bacterium]|jgi:hypothetical protein|nr:hypothetical protein [Clostridiales bacterium]